MAISVEELAAKLNAEAARRGTTPEKLLDEFSEALRVDDALEAFIGCGASGRTEPMDIRRERTELAAKKLSQGI
jgi:hypothetical protein